MQSKPFLFEVTLLVQWCSVGAVGCPPCLGLLPFVACCHTQVNMLEQAYKAKGTDLTSDQSSSTQNLQSFDKTIAAITSNTVLIDTPDGRKREVFLYQD